MAGIHIPEPFKDDLEERIQSSIRIINPFEDPSRQCPPPGKPARKRPRSSSRGSSASASTSVTEIHVDPIVIDDQRDECAGNDSVPDINIPSISIDDMDFSKPSSSHIFDDDSSDVLYPGATITTFQATTILTSWFSLYPGITKSAFDRLLQILHMYILPEGNNLPGTYSDAHKSLSRFLTPVKEYHCCVNDCIIYRDSTTGKYAYLVECPICKEPRYKEGNNKIPRKRFHHLPLELRLRRIFGHKVTSQLFQQHTENNEGSPLTSTCSTGIHNSKAWEEWFGPCGIFRDTKQALPLGICLDGVNPFSKENVSYSMWPITIFPLSLPHKIRKSSGSMMLAGIVQGPDEPHDFNAYLDVVVDDILALNKMEMYDAYHDITFKMKADILLHVFDYPGHNKIFHCQGAGAYSGCAYCTQRGEHCKSLSKMVYLEHRSFLPVGDPLRLDVHNFPEKNTCVSLPPSAKTQKFVDDANRKYLAAETKKARTAAAQITGCKGSNSFHRLPLHDRHRNTPVEPMHLIKNISEHVVKLLTGAEDSAKVRAEEQKRGRFASSWPVQTDQMKKVILPPAPFRLSKSESKIANNRALCIRTPHGFDWTAKEIFIEKAHMKSVQWKHVVTSGMLQYCLRGLLGNFQRKTLFELCDVLSLILAEEVNYSQFDAVEYRLHRVLCLLECDFPVSLHVIVFHLLHHLPMFICRFGPAYSFWMYPFERFNSWIGQRIHNRRFPEATAIETYRLFEVTHFVRMTNQLPQGSTLDFWDILGDDDGVQVHGLQSSTTSLNAADFIQLCDVYRELNKTSRKQLLTVVEDDELRSPENKIVECNFLTKRDNHGRLFRYSSDNPKFKHSSCMVYTRFGTSANQVVFGKITNTFQHTFNGQLNDFLYIHWYHHFERDKESNLIIVDTNIKHSFLNPIISVSCVSKPLIYAHDTETCKLFILNCPPSIK